MPCTICAILLLLLLASPSTRGYTIRVCTDKDCLLDGAADAISMASSLAPATCKVEACGCLGPCGGGPNIQVKDGEGKAVRDGRPGKSSYYLFKGVDSAEEVASMYSFVTGKEVGTGRLAEEKVMSTRGPLDLDRTTRIGESVCGAKRGAERGGLEMISNVVQYLLPCYSLRSSQPFNVYCTCLWPCS